MSGENATILQNVKKRFLNAFGPRLLSDCLQSKNIFPGELGLTWKSEFMLLPI